LIRRCFTAAPLPSFEQAIIGKSNLVIEVAFSFSAASRKAIQWDSVALAIDLEGALQPYQRGYFPSIIPEELPTFIERFECNEARLSVDTREIMELLMLTLLMQAKHLKSTQEPKSIGFWL
jgi:hypothetical protein